VVIIPGLPDSELTNIKKINKDRRSSTQLIRVKTKEDVATKNNRAVRGETKHKRLKSRQNTLSKGTKEEQMLKGLNGSTTKRRQRDWQTKRNKMLRGVKNAMSNPPIKVNYLAIGIKKGERAPRGRPIKDTKRGHKLHNTMQLNNVHREKVQITGFGGHIKNRSTKMKTERAKNQGTARRRKRTIKTLPRNQEQLIERRQETRGKGKRVRKDFCRRSVKTRLKPKGHEGHPARRRETKRLTH